MSPKPSYQIVLIDDEAAHRLIARRAIKQQFEASCITEASTAKQAISILEEKRNSSDIVILDFNLGPESGLAVLQALRQNNSPNNTVVLVVSTSMLFSDIEKSYLLGANCYLFKSSDTKEYQRNLSQALKFFLA